MCAAFDTVPFRSLPLIQLMLITPQRERGGLFFRGSPPWAVCTRRSVSAPRAPRGPAACARRLRFALPRARAAAPPAGTEPSPAPRAPRPALRGPRAGQGPALL